MAGVARLEAQKSPWYRFRSGHGAEIGSGRAFEEDSAAIYWPSGADTRINLEMSLYYRYGWHKGPRTADGRSGPG